MSSEKKSAEVSDAPEVRSGFAESRGSSGDEEKQLLSDAIRSVPSSAVKDLLSAAVCVRCVFRLLGIEQQNFCCCSFSLSLLRSVIEDSACSEPGVESEICSVCVGILTLVRKENVNNMAQSVAELVRREGYDIDSFSLEVSVPPVVLESENAIMSDLKRKYGSETWFQEKSFLERISIKDALKYAIAEPLEALLGVKYSVSSFRIRLTFRSSRGSKMVESPVRKVQDYKRQKTGSNNETTAIIARPSNDLEGRDDSYSLGFSAEKVNEPCHLELLCHRTPIYLGGRYLKYSRNVSQTRWMIDEERMGEASVEEIIGGNILPTCKGDNYKFHAAGREDIDVRMLGSGRPFLVEIHNARQIPSEGILKDVEARINGLENKLVGVKNLKMVGIEGWDMMREGEAEKQKQYVALVWISRPLEDEDMKSVSLFKDMQIMQKTPIRVLHRRSPLERGKIIHWMKTERIAGSSQYFLLHLCTQAGTYIKEFVHGDLGRTHPSIGSILKCRAEILQLDVTDVKMDCFL